MNLEAYLREQAVPFEFIAKTHTVHTADAAAATGLPLEQITKSLVCLAPDGAAYMAIIPGTCKVNLKAVAEVLAVPKLRLCPFAEAHQYSGYPPGGTPPVHYANVAGVVLDQSLLQFEWLYGGGGDNERLIKLKTTDVARLNRAVVAEVVS